MKKLFCFVLLLCLFNSIICPLALASSSADSAMHTSPRAGNVFDMFNKGLSEANDFAKIFSAATSGAAGNPVAECDGKLTRVEAISVAAKLHSLNFKVGYDFPETKPWHKSYIDYALKYRIIVSADGTLNSAVSRGELAYMLYKAFPNLNLPEIGYVLDGSIRDVEIGSRYAEAIYHFTKSGVFFDLDENGNFRPEESVEREELYSIISRILMPGLRKPVELKGYVGSTAPVQERADDDFFSDACFIGNSLVDGLSYYSGMNKAAYFATTGMTVLSAASKYDFLSPSGYGVTAVGAAAAGAYSKVYIELGINEIGLEVWEFIAYYSSIIDKLKSSLPNSDIYILSLTPVNTERDSGGVYTMASVNAYNEALKKLAIEKGCYYLDCVTSMVDETGFLSDVDTWDGVHFYEHKYWEWEEIIRTHYVN